MNKTNEVRTILFFYINLLLEDEACYIFYLKKPKPYNQKKKKRERKYPSPSQHSHPTLPAPPKINNILGEQLFSSSFVTQFFKTVYGSTH